MVGFLSVVALLILGFSVGTMLEKRHFESIEARERAMKDIVCVSLKRADLGEAQEGKLLVANVVVSADYFKSFVASIKGIFGGRLRTYETLLLRARREALLRLKAEAQVNGYHAIMNVRLETSRLTNRSGDNGLGGVEVLAYGTGMRRKHGSPYRGQ